MGIGAAIGGPESRGHPNPEQGLSGSRPGGEPCSRSLDSAPAATKGSNPVNPERMACVFDET
jgi:hypothetical protein